jgi:hypothetical protein
MRKKMKAHDFSVTAFKVVQEATEEKPPETEPAKPPRKDYDYKELGHKGGLKGGKARASKLTPEQRKEIAKKAANARWKRTIERP